MARSKLTETTEDLLTDSGSVLWSFIKGEQLEFPLTLSFLQNATAGYTYEAVVVEALNSVGQTDKPTATRPGGIQTRLTVRVPVYKGMWQDIQAYNTEDVVLHNGVYYRLISGLARVNSTIPPNDPMWTITTLNKVYLQFPSTLASTWQVQPGVLSPSYGFFELRVTEPNTPNFRRTWKPIRGMVEILFSPTDVVADV